MTRDGEARIKRCHEGTEITKESHEKTAEDCLLLFFVTFVPSWRLL
jgi:hypothetical protein